MLPPDLSRSFRPRASFKKSVRIYPRSAPEVLHLYPAQTCVDCKLPLDDLLSCSKKGTSLTFVTRDDWRQARKLINIMVEANQVTDIDKGIGKH